MNTKPIFVYLILLHFIVQLPVVQAKFNQGNSLIQISQHAMVVSADERASAVGVSILKKGGNAIDAAVAVGFALAVVYPEAGNIGGGGFMLIHFSYDSSVVIDFRETAPASAYDTLFYDSTGNVSKEISTGHKSAGVPGTVAGLILAQEMYGRLSIEEILQPAIELAKNGFVVDQRLETALNNYKDELILYSSTREIFFKDGILPKAGDTLCLPDLASTLYRIQKSRGDDFYKGKTSNLIVQEMEKWNGLITKEDLLSYRPIIRKPLRGRYREYEIETIPPPSSGGIALIQLLNIIENFDLRKTGYGTSASIHIITESMKYAFADRSRWLGDPDFFRVPINGLISKQYAYQIANQIDLTKATSSNRITRSNPLIFESEHTTHYAVTDEEGICVAVTYTLNDLFGGKIIVPGAGFFLNNEMDDFSVRTGSPNIYGLVHDTANIIKPGKRPLSSMTPTIILKDKKPMIIIGSRGGPRIISSVFQTIVNIIDFKMPPQIAVDLPRFHHQWLPDELVFEQSAFSIALQDSLRRIGHNLQEINSTVGKIQLLYIDPNSKLIIGISDYREGGGALGY